MRTMVAVFLLFAIPTAFAEGETKCSMLPKSQQAVFAAFNAYIKSGSDLDAVLFAGAISQYQTDIEEFGNKNDPNRGNNESVDLYESSAASLCKIPKAIEILESRVNRGEKPAIKLILLYSALYLTDGAGAEDLSEIQAKIRAKFPALVRQIQAENPAFFRAHPIKWLPLS